MRAPVWRAVPQAAEAEAAATAASVAERDPAKFSGKKSKAVAKKGAGSTQWDILVRSGIPEAEVPQFRCALGRARSGAHTERTLGCQSVFFVCAGVCWLHSCILLKLCGLQAPRLSSECVGITATSEVSAPNARPSPHAAPQRARHRASRAASAGSL